MTDTVTMPTDVAMQTVDSSHHSRQAYDAAKQQLYIDFAKPGKPANIYRYSNFTPADHKAYMESDSKGKHFLAHIKPQTEKFPFVKVAPVEQAP